MDEYVKLATIYLDDPIETQDIAQALVNAGYTVAFSIDYQEIYILREGNYDRK